MLVCPRRDVKRFTDLTAEETSDLWLTAQKIGRQLESYHKASSLTLAIQVRSKMVHEIESLIVFPHSRSLVSVFNLLLSQLCLLLNLEKIITLLISFGCSFLLKTCFLPLSYLRMDCWFPLVVGLALWKSNDKVVVCVSLP